MKAVILLYLPPQQSSECVYNLKDFFLNGLKEQKSYTNWLIVKYIYAVQSIKVNTFPWTIFFSYILLSPRHPWKQKSLWLYTSSEKQMFLQAISFSLSPSHPLSPPPPLFFNEIFIKISFSAQAQRQVTLQSWDKMKLLTDKMSIQIHTLVLRKKTSNFMSRYLQWGGHSAFQSHKVISVTWLSPSLCPHMTPGWSLLKT